MTAIDLIWAGSLYFGLLLLALRWFYRSKQDKLPKTARTAMRIALRLTFVYGTLFFFFVYLFGASGRAFVIGFVIFLSLLIVPVDDEVSFSIIAVPMLLAYIVVQYVLCWPNHDDFVLKPPSSPGLKPPPEEPAASELDNAIGKVIAPLKPTGTVEIDGQSHSAATVDGQFYDIGTKVIVCGRRNTTLLVKSVHDGDAKCAQPA